MDIRRMDERNMHFLECWNKNKTREETKSPLPRTSRATTRERARDGGWPTVVPRVISRGEVV